MTNKEAKNFMREHPKLLAGKNDDDEFDTIFNILFFNMGFQPWLINKLVFRFGPIKNLRRPRNPARQEVESLVGEEHDSDQQPPTFVLRESTRRRRQEVGTRRNDDEVVGGQKNLGNETAF